MGDDGMLCVTSSSHIPNLGLLALGRSDGTIVLVRALDVLFRHLLRDAAKHQQGTYIYFSYQQYAHKSIRTYAVK